MARKEADTENLPVLNFIDIITPAKDITNKKQNKYYCTKRGDANDNVFLKKGGKDR